MSKRIDYQHKWDAWSAWQAWADKARLNGYDELAVKFRPPANASRSKIEKCTRQLQAALDIKQLRLF